MATAAHKRAKKEPTNVVPMAPQPVTAAPIAPEAGNTGTTIEPPAVLKIKAYPFDKEAKAISETAIEIDLTDEMPGNAVEARQFQADGNWYFHDHEGTVIQTDAGIWDNAKMSPLLVRPPVLVSDQTETHDLNPEPPKGATPPEPVPTTINAGAQQGPGVYPKMIERRSLRVALPPEEMSRLAMECARLIRELQIAEEEKKAAAAQHAAEISRIKEEQNDAAEQIREGFYDRRVDCEWLYECSGIESDSLQPVFHPEMKVLIRLDTMAVIETARMKESDFAKKELELKQPAPSPTNTQTPAPEPKPDAPAPEDQVQAEEQADEEDSQEEEPDLEEAEQSNGDEQDEIPN